ncbi:hypothetical protein [Actinomyces bowdenii]|uniref:hypothetical protein n=1 Tax=Actinomyces bowdenii TaxID=131109 RepID=UPI001FB99522|nr:hypothetical protein [Actinomyces bowdenii]
MTAVPQAAAPGARPYDWRRHCRTVPPGATRGGLAAVDIGWGALCLVVASLNLDFILDYGPYPVYVLNLGVSLVLALLQFLRLRLLRAALIATYSMLAVYALLVLLSPVNLGLDPIIITAVTSLHAVTRWEPDRRWGTPPSCWPWPARWSTPPPSWPAGSRPRPRAGRWCPSCSSPWSSSVR